MYTRTPGVVFPSLASQSRARTAPSHEGTLALLEDKRVELRARREALERRSEERAKLERSLAALRSSAADRASASAGGGPRDSSASASASGVLAECPHARDRNSKLLSKVAQLDRLLAQPAATVNARVERSLVDAKARARDAIIRHLPEQHARNAEKHRQQIEELTRELDEIARRREQANRLFSDELAAFRELENKKREVQLARAQELKEEAMRQLAKQNHMTEENEADQTIALISAEVTKQWKSAQERALERQACEKMRMMREVLSDLLVLDSSNILPQPASNTPAADAVAILHKKLSQLHTSAEQPAAGRAADQENRFPQQPLRPPAAPGHSPATHASSASAPAAAPFALNRAQQPHAASTSASASVPAAAAAVAVAKTPSGTARPAGPATSAALRPHTAPSGKTPTASYVTHMDEDDFELDDDLVDLENDTPPNRPSAPSTLRPPAVVGVSPGSFTTPVPSPAVSHIAHSAPSSTQSRQAPGRLTVSYLDQSKSPGASDAGFGLDSDLDSLEFSRMTTADAGGRAPATPATPGGDPAPLPLPPPATVLPAARGPAANLAVVGRLIDGDAVSDDGFIPNPAPPPAAPPRTASVPSVVGSSAAPAATAAAPPPPPAPPAATQPALAQTSPQASEPLPPQPQPQQPQSQPQQPQSQPQQPQSQPQQLQPQPPPQAQPQPPRPLPSAPQPQTRPPQAPTLLSAEAQKARDEQQKLAQLQHQKDAAAKKKEKETEDRAARAARKLNKLKEQQLQAGSAAATGTTTLAAATSVPPGALPAAPEVKPKRVGAVPLLPDLKTVQANTSRPSSAQASGAALPASSRSISPDVKDLKLSSISQISAASVLHNPVEAATLSRVTRSVMMPDDDDFDCLAEFSGSILAPPPAARDQPKTLAAVVSDDEFDF